MLASKGLDATVIGKMFQTIYSLLDNAPRSQLPDLVRYPKEDGLSDRKKPKYLSLPIDNFGHDLHYYSERPMDVQQPEWHPQWENYIPEHERSPTPGREPTTRKSIRDKKSAIQKSIMQARGRKNSHKPSMQGGKQFPLPLKKWIFFLTFFSRFLLFRFEICRICIKYCILF